MNPRLLLDTHVLVRWLSAPRKLSREQARVLREAVHRGQPVGVSAMSLLEIAVLFDRANRRGAVLAAELLTQVESNPVFQVIPLTTDIAMEVVALGDLLRDPADRAIVCTARVRQLRLVTSDQRIIESNLVPIVC